MQKQASIKVYGMVQGVGFRYKIRAEANQRKITGCIKNLDDGSVEIECVGEQEKIDELLASIRDVREPMYVEDIKVSYANGTSSKYKSFQIIPGDLASEMIEGFSTGAMYLNKLDLKMDKMLDKQDKMLDKQDKMLDKQDQTVSEIRTLSSNMHDMMDNRFQKIEAEISKIKTKMGI